MPTDIFSTPGSHQWLCPENVFEVIAGCRGGAGGGGGAGALSGEGGGGAGAGGYSRQVVPVVPGNSYALNVGNGGTGNTSTGSGTAGGDSWFESVGTVLAKGGSPGAGNATGGAGGVGGSAASGVGDVKFSGGNGAARPGSNQGGGGGGGAGDAANGGNASGVTGGAAGTAGGGGGGNGGQGGNGIAGALIGGGGGGGGPIGGNGANGARGEVSLTYEAAAPPATTTLLATSLIENSGFSTITIEAINEDPDSPDTDWAIASSNHVTTTARVGFDTPPGNPVEVQTFKAWVRRNSASGTGTPRGRIDLYENGILLANGVENDITTLFGGQLIVQTFDLAGIALSDPTGAGIEARFVGTRSGGNQLARASVDLGALNWDTVTYEELAPPPEDLIPPDPAITLQTKMSISRQPGYDQTDIHWSVNEDYQAYEIRIVPPLVFPGPDTYPGPDLYLYDEVSRLEGVLVESGGGGLADVEQVSTITDDEVVAVSPADEEKLFRLWVQDSAGNWG